ncbi:MULTISPECIES: NAD(P)H-dependent oxidoreductase [Stappia]|uniref:NADPH-quinone reductase (Modulator of drug activity B) n=1 Tax=Stappia indica TaxID=538381 RepID=A0A285TIP1_9HYPH|nr:MULTISPECIES: NAD(P)H-dependent oxidoreductase [Stappia]MBC2861190.1 NAD(P)H-dependent oxidoreductase [Stappia sp. 28M-7]SOC21882.1 Putative NADPH-quinone reductase (modulator of drug activity B) [Stappia indica]
MRVLLIHAHPVEESFSTALKNEVLRVLVAAGHSVEECDLYARGFDPVLSREERLAYHDVERNREPVAEYVEQLMRAEAIVLVYPVWNFGFPAILKGYFDRVFLPGVSFRMRDGKVVPNLQHIRRLVAVTTYGGSRLRACLVGDPPRKLVRRVLRALIAPTGRLSYLALYDMNRIDEAGRKAFVARVTAELKRL